MEGIIMSLPLYLDDALVWGAWHRWWYAPFFLGAIGLVILGLITYRQRLKLLSHRSYALLMLPGYAPWRGICKAILQVVAIMTLFIALLQPQWGRKDVSVTQEGRDVLIALDISRSMQAKDIKPSRLTFVKIKIQKLLERLSFERVGLILFSGNAFVQCPLTADYKTFKMFLDQVTTEAISSGTTAIGTAITQASTVFNRSKNRKNKLLVLITDGEDFASNMERVSQQVADEGITIVSWGAGTPQGAPIPLFDGSGNAQGHARDKDGKLATSKLNEPLLRRLSDDLHGRYERVTQDDGDIARIADYLKTFEREQFEERKLSEYHDQYPYFLAVTWICLLLEWLL